MRKPSVFRLFAALTAVAAIVACGENASPTSPVTQAPGLMLSRGSSGHSKPQPQQKSGRHHLASCNIPHDVLVSARIGPHGGTLDLGEGNTVYFPPGALLTDTTIVAHVPAGTTARVFFTPEGLHFPLPAVVTLSYSACITPSSLLAIVYLQADTVSEVEPTTSNPTSQKVTATINHFSSYAVAY
ncbi:MAG: hypothetical protein M3Y05_16735 [Gemmatimonadota bacterium]|nr:hypothetical protein [Gemmatimonadota bacterium]